MPSRADQSKISKFPKPLSAVKKASDKESRVKVTFGITEDGRTERGLRSKRAPERV